MVRNHRELLRTVHMALDRMVYCSCFDRVPGPYFGIQEKTVVCNYSRSNYYILVERPNSPVQSAGKEDVS